MNLILLEPSDFTGDDLRLVRLTGRRFQHIATVIRAHTGDSIRVGLVDGLLGSGTITEIYATGCEMEITLSDQPPAPLPLTLIIALPRPKSLKKSLEAAASLGIKKIVIIESWRVEKSYWSSPVLREESLRRHLLLGLEQARDTTLPQIEIRRRFKPFMEDELPALTTGALPLVAHPYNAHPCPAATEQPVVLMIGPEGGFIEYEINSLLDAGFSAVTIGERILRVETAIAAFTGRLWR